MTVFAGIFAAYALFAVAVVAWVWWLWHQPRRERKQVDALEAAWALTDDDSEDDAPGNDYPWLDLDPEAYRGGGVMGRRRTRP